MSQIIDLLKNSTVVSTNDHLSTMNKLLATIAQNTGKGTTPTTWKEVQELVRQGLAPSVFAIGDQLSCYKATSATADIGESTGITAATVDLPTFISAVNQSDAGQYVFTFDGASWIYNGKVITPAAYGITITGTATSGDVVTVTLEGKELVWDIIGFDEDVFQAWRSGSKVYYTCVDEPAINELVFELIGQTFSPVGYVSTAYDVDAETAGITIGAEAGTYTRDSDNDTADGTHRHTMTLQLHDCYTNVQFDATEALYYCESPLSPGTYYFTLLSGYDAEYGGNRSYQFQTTKTVPAGGVLMFPWPYLGQAADTKVSSYVSITSLTAIESVPVTVGTSGVELTGCNHTHRIRYGSNDWHDSAMRQFLNTDAAAGTYWTSQHKFDRPPGWEDSLDGWIRGLDPTFKSVISPSCKVINLNTIVDMEDPQKYLDEDDTGNRTVGERQGVRISRDLFFLPSYTEMFFGKLSVDDKSKSRDISIGRPYSYYRRLAKSPTPSALAGRIKYLNGVACWWWSRSAGPWNGNYLWRVNSEGASHGDGANNSYGCAPACNIM